MNNQQANVVTDDSTKSETPQLLQHRDKMSSNF